MEWLLIAVVLLGFMGLAALVYAFHREQTARPGIDPSTLLMLQKQVDSLAQEIRGTMHEQTRQQQTSGHQMTHAVRDVTERLVKLEETNKQILSFSGQLENLQRILTNPKHRGVLGEYFLETLLKTMFAPDAYQMQYSFKDGEIVDAVLFLQDKIVPIDSKFSLENYNRFVTAEQPSDRLMYEKAFANDLKMRIKETSKYIRPHEGTMDFAFMFLPHEGMYYDLLTNTIGDGGGEEVESLIYRAAAKYRVIIVSPTSFTAYLQTVLQGLRALKIEEQAQDIRQRVVDLGRHIQAFETHFTSVGKHMGTVVSQYNLAGKELSKIDKDVLRITGEGTGAQPLTLDKPTDGE